MNFGNGVTVASALEADLLIEAEERRYTAFVRETAPSEALCRYLLAEYDYHNAEAIVRSKYLKTDCAPMLGADGFYRADKMRDNIYADKYDLFPAPSFRACRESDALFLSGQANGQNIAILFRRALYADRAV